MMLDAAAALLDHWSATWTEAMTGSLLELYETGMSGRDIATEINARHGSRLTRNAVIGKLHRLGLRREKPVRKVRTVRYERKFRAPRDETPIPLPAPRPTPAPFTCKPVPLLELPFRSACKYEVSGSEKIEEFRFCANPVEGEKPYCGEHCRIAYR